MKVEIAPIVVRVSTDVRDRLRHHANRFGLSIVDIVRQGAIEKLERLDQTEAFELEQKRLRERHGAYVPRPVKHKWGRPPGLGKKMPAVSTTAGSVDLEKVRQKFLQSFKRWAEFIEQGEDRSDRERRCEIVLEDIRDRTSDEAEVQTTFAEFKKFLDARAQAMPKPTEIVDANLAILNGDIEE
jgi:hypothetical protein